ncbi:MAG: hypothetical protein ABJK64_07940 [Paraglaciecola sp.]|uniref:hypothetical protein n=1 Tax=Paraglaciecola sp. TaxID=1920173 RepID=UPI003299F353
MKNFTKYLLVISNIYLLLFSFSAVSEHPDCANEDTDSEYEECLAEELEDWIEDNVPELPAAYARAYVDDIEDIYWSSILGVWVDRQGNLIFDASFYEELENIIDDEPKTDEQEQCVIDATENKATCNTIAAGALAVTTTGCIALSATIVAGTSATAISIAAIVLSACEGAATTAYSDAIGDCDIAFETEKALCN